MPFPFEGNVAAAYSVFTAIADTSGGSANVQNVSRAQARTNLEGVFATLQGESVARVVVGSGGIDTAEDANALKELIQPLAPDAVGCRRIRHWNRSDRRHRIGGLGHQRRGPSACGRLGLLAWR
ncbi:hypothetical protein [Arthrobacter sp. 2MCAF14]|uniref:hypothetical protein n=1 Tax=Arthrobacter sp. 2MCAF14 TaxID=3232982 RepID=UPI003F8DF14A